MSKDKEVYWVSGEMLPIDLGEMIMRLRTELLSLTHEGLAEAIGIKVDTLVACEKGRTNNVYNTLMKVCRKFKLTTICQIKPKSK